jgi:hypothetical protein
VADVWVVHARHDERHLGNPCPVVHYAGRGLVGDGRGEKGARELYNVQPV